MTTLWTFFLFISVNCIKLTVSSVYMTQERNPANVLFRFVRTLALTILLYTVLFSRAIVPLAAFYVLQIIYLYISLSYFNFYHYYLHLLQSLMLLRESSALLLRRSVPRNINQLLALADVPVFLCVLEVFDGNALSSFLDTHGYPLILVCIVVLLGAEAAKAMKGQFLLQLLKAYPASELQMVKSYGTLLNMVIDFCLYPTCKKISSQYDYGAAKQVRITSQSKPDILIIQAESLDANTVLLSHEGAYVMPFLHSLMESSIYYPFTMNYHMAGGTSDAESSIMNSVQPLRNFPSIKLPCYEYGNSFVRILSRNGYSTAAFHGNQAGYYNRASAFSGMGYDKFYGIEEMKLKNIGWGAPDHEVLDYVLEKAGQEASPFFYYIITMSNHCRFTNALKYHNDSRFAGIKNKDMRNFYNSLSYVDATLASFVKKIRTLDKDIHIVILGDHTPGLGKKIYKDASLAVDERHLEFVPLFILTPDDTLYREKELAASFLDIAPTVLELAGIQTSYPTYGGSLLPPGTLTGKIPYRDRFFDRRQLYREIEQKQIHIR